MYGIALEGGGMRGSYHLGAIKAIKECNIEIGGYVGTSIGAFNAAVLAQGDYEKLYDKWYTGSSAIGIDVKENEVSKLVNKKLDFGGIKYWTRFVKDNLSNRGIDYSKLKSLYDEMIDEEKLRKSKLDFGMVTVSLTDKKPIYLFKEDIPFGLISTYVLASSNLPVFKQEKLLNDDKTYIDGGFYDNCPLTLLKKKGYKDIIEIRTHAIGIYKKIDKSGLNVITINASKDLGGVIFSDNKLIKDNINMGYFDTLRVLKGYIGNKFYVIPTENNKVFERLNNLTDEEILKIAKAGNLKNIENIELKKLLFENILLSIENKLKNMDISSYQKLIVSMIEYITENELEIYKLYTFDELLNNIKEKIPAMLKKENGSLIKNNTNKMILTFLKNI